MPDSVIANGTVQDFQKLSGFKMMLNVTVTLTKQVWNLQLINDGILGTMSPCSLEIITRDAVTMNIILLFQASVNNLNGLKPTGVHNTPFLLQIFSIMSLPLLPSYKPDLCTAVAGVKDYPAVFTWTDMRYDTLCSAKCNPTCDLLLESSEVSGAVMRAAQELASKELSL